MDGFGWALEHGSGLNKDARTAAAWYAKASVLGNSQATNNLERLYYNGDGVSQDFQKAFALFENSATGGNAIAMLNLAKCYARGDGIPANNTIATQWLEASAAAGCEAAQKMISDFASLSYYHNALQGLRRGQAEDAEKSRQQMDAYRKSVLSR